jgi:hypothetical protein
MTVFLQYLEAAAIIVIAIRLLFFKSYFTKRGEIDAIKKDLKEVTDQVEKVKAEVAFEHSIRTSMETEKRMVVIGVYEKLHFLRNFLSDTLTLTSEWDGDEEQEKRKEVAKVYTDFLLSQAKFRLYVENEEVNSRLEDIREILLKMVKIVDIYVFTNFTLQRQQNSQAAMEEINGGVDIRKYLERGQVQMDFYNQYKEVFDKDNLILVEKTDQFRNDCFNILTSALAIK